MKVTQALYDLRRTGLGTMYTCKPKPNSKSRKPNHCERCQQVHAAFEILHPTADLHPKSETRIILCAVLVPQARPNLTYKLKPHKTRDATECTLLENAINISQSKVRAKSHHPKP